MNVGGKLSQWVKIDEPARKVRDAVCSGDGWWLVVAGCRGDPIMARGEGTPLLYFLLYFTALGDQLIFAFAP